MTTAYDDALLQQQQQQPQQQPQQEATEQRIKAKVMISYAWQPPESAQVAQELNLLLKVRFLSQMANRKITNSHYLELSRSLSLSFPLFRFNPFPSFFSVCLSVPFNVSRSV